MAETKPPDLVDAVRLRPGMYIGGTDSRALLTLLFAAAQISFEQAPTRHVTRIDITLQNDNSVKFSSNGPGFSVDKHLEFLADTRVGVYPERGSARHYWLWSMACHAVSTRSCFQIRQAEQVWEQHFEAGRPLGPMQSIRPMQPNESTGNTLTFLPDPTIFEANAAFSYPDLYVHLREIAYLIPGLRITLRDERGDVPQEAEFYSEHGLANFVRYLNRDCETLHEVIYGTETVEFRPTGRDPFTVRVDFAFQFTDCAESLELSYANLRHTPEGGTHLLNMRRGVWTAIEDLRRGYMSPPRFTEHADTFRLPGMTAVIAAYLPDPMYYGCVCRELANVELAAAHPIVYRHVRNSLPGSSDALKRVLDRTPTHSLSKEARRYGECAGQVQFEYLWW